MKAEINFQFNNEIRHYQFEQPKTSYYFNQHEREKFESTLTYLESCEDYIVMLIDYEAAPLFSNDYQVKQSEYPVLEIHTYERPTDVRFHQSQKDVTFVATEDQATIVNQLNTIQDEIRLGNTYQVNYTTRLTGYGEINYQMYQALLKRNNGKYTAYFERSNRKILSMSPELFFEYDPEINQLLARPMKGTMPVTNDREETKRNYQFLRTSTKDQAENVMIVDLLRNDMSKIATKGSVKVPQLFEITQYDTVFQMTSDISANLKHKRMLDILDALFPCGSITGAPKVSTMQIINQLESEKRGIYCGAIGLITPKKEMVFNVPIRTIEQYGHKVQYGVGGGITINSIPNSEYDEMMAKSQVLKQIGDVHFNDGIKNPHIDLPKDFHLIETMRFESNTIKRLDLHMQRLKQSAQYFNIQLDIDEIEKQLYAACFTFVENQTEGLPVFMVRLTCDLNGNVEINTKTLPDSRHDAKIAGIELAEACFHQNKTSIRAQYGDPKELLLLHYNGDALEFNIGNLVYEIDGVKYTPLSKYILNGCFKQSIQTELTERNIHIDDLMKGHSNGTIKVYLINSLREWVLIDNLKMQ